MRKARADVCAYILAGGKSSRFGSDKARAVIDGRTLIERTAAELRSCFARVRAVARSPHAYADVGVETIADRRPALGPLAGLHAAILDAPTSWVFIVSCDFVAIRQPWIDRLLDAATDTAQAIAFRHQLWEPLFAVYHRSILPVLEARLDSGALAMQQLLESVSVVELPVPADWPPNAHVNTPEELALWTSRQG